MGKNQTPNFGNAYVQYFIDKQKKENFNKVLSDPVQRGKLEAAVYNLPYTAPAVQNEPKTASVSPNNGLSSMATAVLGNTLKEDIDKLNYQTGHNPLDIYDKEQMANYTNIRSQVKEKQQQLRNLQTGMSTPSLGKSLWDNGWQGLVSGFTKPATSVVKNILDFVDFAAFLGSENPAKGDTNTLFPWAKALDDAAARDQQYFNDKATKTNTASSPIQAAVGKAFGGVTAALPAAALAVATRGQSALSTTAGLVDTAAIETAPTTASIVGKLGNLAEPTRQLIVQYAKDPNYWLSYVQSSGSAYDQAIASGASHDQAMAASLISGLINSAIEMGGLQELPKQLANKSPKAINAWVETMIDEGNEEVLQGIVSNLSAKAVYKPNAPAFSLTDQNAVINPVRSAGEWAGGAFGGGILGGGQILANSVFNNTVQGTTINKAGLDAAQEHIDNAKEAFEFAETPASYKNTLKTAYAEDFAASRQIKADGAQYQVTINKNTLDNIVSDPKISAEKLAVLPSLDTIVKNAEFVGSGLAPQRMAAAKSGGKQSSIRHDYFEAPVTINGEAYLVKLAVVNKNSGNSGAQHVISSIDVVKAPVSGSRTDTSGTAAKPSSYRFDSDQRTAENTDSDALSKEYIKQMKQIRSIKNTESNTPVLVRDVGQRYNGTDGVGRTPEGAGDAPIKPYTTSRPKYGSTQVDDVWNSHVDSETGTVTDPSGARIVWDRTKPRNGQWDMGHIPGHKYSDIHSKYMNGEISLDEFLKWYRNPQNYRPELPGTNRSHLYENGETYLK